MSDNLETYRSYIGNNKLISVHDIVPIKYFSDIYKAINEEIDIDVLLSRSTEYGFMLDLNDSKMIVYKGLADFFLESHAVLPDDMGFIQIHTHPLASLLTNDDTTSTYFPSLTDLFTLFGATLQYSLDAGKYTPVMQYVLSSHHGSHCLLSYQFTKSIIDAIASDQKKSVEENQEKVMSNLDVAFNIVLSNHKTEQSDFVDILLREINENVYEGIKVLDINVMFF